MWEIESYFLEELFDADLEEPLLDELLLEADLEEPPLEALLLDADLDDPPLEAVLEAPLLEADFDALFEELFEAPLDEEELLLAAFFAVAMLFEFNG